MSRSKRKSASAAGTGSDPLTGVWDDVVRAAQSDDWQGVVQDYVKNAVGKASGLGWLFDAATGQQEDKKDRRRR